MGASTFRVAIRRCVIAGIIAGASVDSVRAQGAASYPSVLTYRTVRVADGVYAFITPEERTGFQSGNSIAIIGDSSVLVFDTGNIPGATRRQIAEIRRLTSKPVRYVVNSHWHPDHNLGNIEYRTAFPGVTIIGTTATRAGILERVPTYIGQMKSFAPTDSLMRLRLSTGRMRDSSKLPDSTRLVWGIYTRDYAEFMPEVLQTKPSPPDLICDDSLTLMLGNRRVKIVSPGRGNTAGDTYAYLPDEHVLLTGDLVTFPGPFTGGDAVRSQAFENFYPFPAVQRAYEEASFEIQGAIPKPGN